MNSNELLDQFVLEARECLEQIGHRLLDVEKDPGNTELLNDLFRQVHTLKGNCGLFDFKPLERVVHAGEDLLDRVRHGDLAYNEAIADALLDAMDYTAELVDAIADEGQLEPGTDERARKLADALRRHLAPAGQAQAAAAAPAPTPAPEQAAPPLPKPDWVQALLADQPSALRRSGHVLMRYRPEPSCFFKGEDPWRQACATPGLLHLSVAPREPWGEPGELDCYRCNLELLLVSQAPRAYVEEHFRYVPEQIELYELNPTAAGIAPQATSAPAPSLAETEAPLPDAARVLLQRQLLRMWGEQRALLARPGLAAGTVAAARVALGRLLRSWGDDAHTQAALATLEQLPPGAAPWPTGRSSTSPAPSRPPASPATPQFKARASTRPRRPPAAPAWSRRWSRAEAVGPAAEARAGPAAMTAAAAKCSRSRRTRSTG